MLKIEKHNTIYKKIYTFATTIINDTYHILFSTNYCIDIKMITV